MQLDKYETSVCRQKPASTKAKPIKQELNCGHSVKNTIEAFVPRYFKVGISISVESELNIHVNMCQSPHYIKYARIRFFTDTYSPV